MALMDEMEHMQKEMVSFKILAQHFNGGTKEIHQVPQIVYFAVAGLRAEINLLKPSGNFMHHQV
jgi:hypothetical protein